ncbi:MAG: hypothetical protein J3K34DRAFT_523237 [Monoraphidium minutum]|nr:MAG: hypothetical protein J3K34DRAFT_523237 [Monoraphidium minutum]
MRKQQAAAQDGGNATAEAAPPPPPPGGEALAATGDPVASVQAAQLQPVPEPAAAPAALVDAQPSAAAPQKAPKPSKRQAVIVLPRLASYQTTLNPRLTREWRAGAPAIEVSEDELLVIIKPRTNPRHRAQIACAAANGTTHSYLTVNAARNAGKVALEAAPTPFAPASLNGTGANGTDANGTGAPPPRWRYFPSASILAAPLPPRTPVYSYFWLNNECTAPDAAQPASRRPVRLALTVTLDPCWRCLKGCARDPTTGATTCEIWDSYCPVSWPSGTATGAVMSVSLHFTPAPNASCASPEFGGAPSGMLAQFQTFMAELFVAGGTTSTAYFGTRAPDTKLYANQPVACADASELNGNRTHGVVQIMLDITPEKGLPTLQSSMITSWHRRDICSSYVINTPAAAGARVVSQRFCDNIGKPGPQIQWAGICVLKARASRRSSKDGWPLESACFPGDASVTRVDPVTGSPLGAAPMSSLAIGNVVECLKPAGFEGRQISDFRDAAQTYVRGACHVFGYHDADADAEETFVVLHYTDARGRAAKLRATATHLVYLAPRALALEARAAALPPGGGARRADMVEVGDLLAVLGKGGALYTAPVEAVTTEIHVGAFAPLLTDAGLLLVDGAAAYSWSHLPAYDPHPMQNIGEYMRHVRLFTDYFESAASGCRGAACPCLDAPADAATPCVRLGDRLADVPKGKSDFARRTIDVWTKAAAEGRTHWDYAGGIALARRWEASALIQWVEKKLLRAAPHAVGIALTDWRMVRPRAEGDYGGGAAAARGAWGRRRRRPGGGGVSRLRFAAGGRATSAAAAASQTALTGAGPCSRRGRFLIRNL